jgi:hypothetical protein
MRWLVVMLVACGRDATLIDAVVMPGDVLHDGSACMPRVLPDAAPASAAPSCVANNLPGSCLDVAECNGTRAPTPGLCAGSAAIECCTPRFADPIACDPDAAPDPNECVAEEPGDPGCPAGMAHVATFCVDRFEASLIGWSPFQRPAGVHPAASRRGAVPQGYISQVQAGASCAAAGKRLCADAEWLRACQGPTTTTYPYGQTRQPGTCNDARSLHPAVELYGTSDAWIYSHLDSPCLNQLAHGLDRTGALTGCVTAEGAFDMMGNLHEWTADPAGTFRGGYYVDTVLNGNGCLYATTAHDPSYADYSTGFRCCANAMP